MESIDYTDLHTIYPTEPLISPTYTIDTIVLSEAQVSREKVSNYRESWLVRGLKANFPYIRLMTKLGDIMMSDTPMERNTNYSFIQKANGDVIIFGLGLGLVILPLLKKKNVKSILVVELYQDLIDLVEPILKKQEVDSKLTIVQGDCFDFHTKIPKERKFDTIYGDIWASIDTENYKEMKVLTKNWKNRLNRSNPDSFINHWLKEDLQRKIQKEKRGQFYW